MVLDIREVFRKNVFLMALFIVFLKLKYFVIENG